MSQFDNHCKDFKDSAFVCHCRICTRGRDKESWDRISKLEFKETTALQEQEGGSHYKDMAIQPIEYCVKNNLNPCQTHMIKYVSRYPNKNGAEDLRKVIHIAKLALFLEYGESYE